MAIAFQSSPQLTLGTEVELQLIDARGFDLCPAAPQIMKRLGDRPHIKPEIFRSMLEINTGICANVGEIRRDLDAALTELRPVCDSLDVELASAGSHPFARHEERMLYPADRYRTLLDRNQWIARRLMIFGLHVHIGVRDADHAMALTNALLPYLPHVLALSASSPYWEAIDTGLASSRITIFESLPTAGTPCTFESWADFERVFEALLAGGAIRSIKDLWWDIRPQPDFGTIELRIADALPTIRETVAIVALIHALASWLDGQIREGVRFSPPPIWLIRENKWRASRWGVEADLIIDTSGTARPLRAELERLLEKIEPFAAAAGCAAELRDLGPMLEAPSPLRQRKIFARTHRLSAVAEALIEELKADRPVLGA